MHKTWPEQIFEVLIRTRVRQVAYVPDAGHRQLIKQCHDDNRMKAIPLTTEEEGIALLAGAWLGGDRGVLLSQSSGLGNCVNMLGMIQECQFPLLVLVTMRGEAGERNPWQIPMGRATRKVLETMGVVVDAVSQANDVEEIIETAALRAFNASKAVAVLISQSLIGVKEFSAATTDDQTAGHH